MLSESEIYSVLSDNFRIAREQCEAIGRGPNGPAYVRLGRAIDKIEGCCRQMGHWRGDARWFRLGMIYKEGREAAKTLYLGQRWGEFSRFSQVWEAGLARVTRLAESATGRPGTLILPAAYEQATRH